jgi:hypothetical protein
MCSVLDMQTYKTVNCCSKSLFVVSSVLSDSTVLNFEGDRGQHDTDCAPEEVAVDAEPEAAVDA